MNRKYRERSQSQTTMMMTQLMKETKNSEESAKMGGLPYYLIS